MDKKATIDLSKSKLSLPSDQSEIETWEERVLDWRNNLIKERNDRRIVYTKRRDFFEGVQAKYTNIEGLTRKEKKGHANAVYNIAGKMITKIYYALGNNPPSYVYRPLKQNDKTEAIKTQAVEDFVSRVYWQNKFWLAGYKRGVINQTLLGNFAVMVYPDFINKRIRIVNLEKMENLMVGWRGDDSTDYDYTIYEEERSVLSIENEFGIKASAINKNSLMESQPTAAGHLDPYGIDAGSRPGNTNSQPHGKTDMPMAKFTDIWTDTHNIILINDQPAQIVKHDFGFNPVKVGRNIHNPGRTWDIADIDYLIDPQIEFNEGMNDVRDFIRTGVNQKFRAHNMPDFDPESLKTGNGQVIFTNQDEIFEPIPVQVNTFPADLYLNRVEKSLHKLGIPEVTFGSGSTAGVSGRARAIDFQSFVDTIIDKQQSWESVLEDISEAIQILGHKYFAPKEGENFFTGPDGEFEVREINFDWSDVMPITQSDKQVDIINKKNANMISMETALGEMGYKDPAAELERIKNEFKDEELAPILTRKTDILEGVVEATVNARMKEMEEMEAVAGDQGGGEADAGAGGEGAPPPNPTMMQSQNQTGSMPMSQPGSGQAFATPAGNLSNSLQNNV